jgi:DNA (cytosine-5)-methyltransferase 1
MRLNNKVYYNDIDKNAAAWLAQLCQMGLIANGTVDNRSITEIQAHELKQYTRLHFFAGIGGWDYALQLAGWPDDKPIVTASLPCQPFSEAGKGLGQRDERHLLPEFIELVKCSNWPLIVGEQVPAAIKHGWMDDLQLEMGKQGYTTGFVVLTAAGQGAPHIRKRIYWVSHYKGTKLQRSRNTRERRDGSSDVSHLAECNQPKQGSRLLHTESQRRNIFNAENVWPPNGKIDTSANTSHSDHDQSPRMQFANSNEWHKPDWIYCRDDKYRPVKPSILPLAYGVSKGVGYSSDPSAPINANETQEARVMRFKGYGNAIVPQVAAQFLRAVMQLI